MSEDARSLALSVHHLAIKASDLARAESFWSGVLGLRVVRRQNDELGARSIWFALDDADLRRRFDDAHRRLFHSADAARPLEVVGLRVQKG